MFLEKVEIDKTLQSKRASSFTTKEKRLFDENLPSYSMATVGDLSQEHVHMQREHEG